MENNRAKQILDSTFRHLELVLEEMKREKKFKERYVEGSRPQKAVRRKKEVVQKQ